MLEEFSANGEIPLGAGNKALPDGKWSHRHVKIITALLSLGAHHNNFTQGAAESRLNRRKDEREMDRKQGLG